MFTSENNNNNNKNNNNNITKMYPSLLNTTELPMLSAINTAASSAANSLSSSPDGHKRHQLPSFSSIIKNLDTATPSIPTSPNFTYTAKPYTLYSTFQSSPSSSSSSSSSSSLHHTHSNAKSIVKHRVSITPPTSVASINKSICQICSKQFDRKSWMLRHMASHQNNRDYNCLWCNSKHKRRDNLVQHLKTKHCEPLLKIVHLEMIKNSYTQDRIQKFVSRVESLFNNKETMHQQQQQQQQQQQHDSNIINNSGIKILINEGILSKDLLKIVLNSLIVDQKEKLSI